MTTDQKNTKTCAECAGTGKIRTWEGADTIQNPTLKVVWCKKCMGSGRLPTRNESDKQYTYTASL